MSERFENQVAVVTGGSRGIGRATALAFAQEGAKVAVVHARPGSADEVMALIEEQGGLAMAVCADVKDMDAMDNALNQILTRFESIDVLVNNAGITQDNLLMRMNEEQWDDVIATNLRSLYVCSRLVSKVMMKKRRGKIINITSVVAQRGNAGQSNYCASKAGVIGFTKSLARELASRQIQVNAVAPGFIETDMTEALTDKQREEMAKEIPAGRLGKPSDVAQTILFLASDAADYMTGQTLNVDGGMVME